MTSILVKTERISGNKFKKVFSQLLIEFLKSRSNFEYFEKKKKKR